jgi:hypothetical protein
LVSPDSQLQLHERSWSLVWRGVGKWGLTSVCWRMLTYADVCSIKRIIKSEELGSEGWQVPRWPPTPKLVSVDECWRMLAYTDVRWRMMTSSHADACSCMLMYVDWEVGPDCLSEALPRLVSDNRSETLYLMIKFTCIEKASTVHSVLYYKWMTQKQRRPYRS